MKLILAVLVLGAFAIAYPAVAQAGNPDQGVAVFAKCRSCHQIGPDAKNSVGPVLNGVVGRKAGTYPGYNYSPATRNSGLVWDLQTLARYVRAPRELVPGTRMAFAGLKKDHEIADVISHLKQFDADGNRSSRSLN
jgi:cytochrome c